MSVKFGLTDIEKAKREEERMNRLMFHGGSSRVIETQKPGQSPNEPVQTQSKTVLVGPGLNSLIFSEPTAQVQQYPSQPPSRTELQSQTNPQPQPPTSHPPSQPQIIATPDLSVQMQPPPYQQPPQYQSPPQTPSFQLPGNQPTQTSAQAPIHALQQQMENISVAPKPVVRNLCAFQLSANPSAGQRIEIESVQIGSQISIRCKPSR